MLWLLGLVAVAGVWLVVWGVLGWADDVGNEGERERRAIYCD